MRQRGTYHPKLDEVLEIRGGYKKTVEQRISQELHKKLVVGEAHAVVHPETWTDAGQRGKGSPHHQETGTRKKQKVKNCNEGCWEEEEQREGF